MMNQNIEQFNKLSGLLSQGWEIEGSVRSQFISQTRETMYHFRLRHSTNGHTTVLIVPKSRALLQFFVRNNIDTCDITWNSVQQLA